MKRIDASNNNRPTTTEVFLRMMVLIRLTSSTVRTTTLGVGYDAIGNIKISLTQGQSIFVRLRYIQ